MVDHAVSRSAQFTGPVGAAFRGALDVLGTSVSGLIYAITFVLPWLVVAVPLWWFIRRRRARAGRSGGGKEESSTK